MLTGPRKSGTLKLPGGEKPRKNRRKGLRQMNKTELVAAVAEKSTLTKKDAAAAIDAVFAVIGDTLQAKQKVQLIGFGTFQTSERKARTGKNPQTGAAVKIAACTVPAFKAGKALKA